MQLNRRKFIKLTAVSGASFVGTCLYLQKPAMAYAQNWLQAFYWFPNNTNSFRLSNTITEYLNNLSSDIPLRERIIEVNRDFSQEGYANYQYSPVYNTEYDFANRLYYPLTYLYCGCLYNITPFYNFTCGCQPVTYIHSPHIAGLGLVALFLKRQGASPEYINSVLLPVQGHSLAQGSPKTGYSGPLEYASEKGHVAVHYVPESESKGTVAVKAVEYGGRILANNEWTLNVGSA